MDLRERILKHDDHETKTETIAEWDGVEVLIKGLSARQVGDLLTRQQKGELDDIGFTVEVVLLSAHDPVTGALLFGEDDRELMGGKQLKVINRLAKIATDLSGIGEDTQEQAEKN